MDAGRDWKKKNGAAGAAFEQSLREARERREAEMEPETAELAAYRLARRREFEERARRRPFSIRGWLEYARWEESQNDYDRARNVWARAFEVSMSMMDHTVWIEYAEFEMKNISVDSGRLAWLQAVSCVPDVDELWHKSIEMEEKLGNIAGARKVLDRWINRLPRAGEQAWLSYIEFELRYNEIERARSMYNAFVFHHPKASAFIRYACFEMKCGEVERARNVYQRATEKLALVANSALASEAAKEDAALLSLAFAEFEHRATCIHDFANLQVT
ncbi:unnamed protein product [Microthlaspi erraticum]|uniref:Pre-mRNA-splicing factor Syf1-like N-terminal HAT-repeats domain-containing protein n=1 Tax=Microthlaspi erraticum TaxID=1685480 RepID=A0A6D2JGY1_9BRAS|nr:unnamed protein product [Microthlaspi erraticum]